MKGIPAGAAGWRDAWRKAGLIHRVSAVTADPWSLPLADKSFDLAWNFVTLSRENFFIDALKEMARVASRSVMTVHCNASNYGHPWHRFLHTTLNLPWTHGSAEFMEPDAAAEAYRSAGIEVVEHGYLDMPFWPDPPGPRDVRLHMKGQAEEGEEGFRDIAWHAPIVDIIRGTSRPSLFLRLLSGLEDLPAPAGIRRRFSHLFYIWGRPQGTGA